MSLAEETCLNFILKRSSLVHALAPSASFEEWVSTALPAVVRLSKSLTSTTMHATKGEDLFDVAVLGGFCADRVAYATAAGYQAAMKCIARLYPPSEDVATVAGHDWSELAAMCASEKGTVSARSFKTAVSADSRVSGEKSFVTGGAFAKWLCVITQPPPGETGLRAAWVSSAAPGVVVSAASGALPFVPELPHAQVSFAQAPATVLSGDATRCVFHGFRVVEDIYLSIALIGHVVALLRRFGGPARGDGSQESSAWTPPPNGLALACGLLAGFHFLALRLHSTNHVASEPRVDAPLLGPGDLIALDGLLGEMTRLVKTVALGGTPGARDVPEAIVRLRRDLPLTTLASAARSARTRSAMTLLAQL